MADRRVGILDNLQQPLYLSPNAHHDSSLKLLWWAKICIHISSFIEARFFAHPTQGLVAIAYGISLQPFGQENREASLREAIAFCN